MTSRQQRWLHYSGVSCGSRAAKRETTRCCGCGGDKRTTMMNVCTAGPQGAPGASISADQAYLGRQTMPFSGLGNLTNFGAAETPLFFANAPEQVATSNGDPTGGVAFAGAAFVTNAPQRITALHVNFETLTMSLPVTDASIAVYYRLPGDVNLSPPVAVVDLFALDVNEHGFVELAPGVDLPEGTQVSVGIALAGPPGAFASFAAVSAGVRL